MSFTTHTLSAQNTTIPGLLLLQLPVHGDNRGWFKENWQREKMLAIGLPDFGPVQHNISFNNTVGTTRGIHAEPWDKYVSVATGRIFGAWVDLREGPTFGAVFTTEIDPSTAIFVPRGVGNAYQTLEPDTAYVYLVNDHWNPQAQNQYTYLNLEDETVAINWPIPLEHAERSNKDLTHPRLTNVTAMPPKRTLVLGANGQLGRALQHQLPDADFADRSHIDLSKPHTLDAVHWQEYDTVINAAAYTAVDHAETPEGRTNCWNTNVTGLTRLTQHVAAHGITLVHLSSDYVFDGTRPLHTEDEPPSPLNVYGHTKAAGDAIVTTLPRHYIVRTSWVIGDGNNFVHTMVSLAQQGAHPRVVNDQFGRLSFTTDIAAGIEHLLRERPAYGVYNLTNQGPPMSWAHVAKLVFEFTGHDPERVTNVTSAQYFTNPDTATRPQHSTLTLDKIKATGFTPRDAQKTLQEYLAQH